MAPNVRFGKIWLISVQTIRRHPGVGKMIAKGSITSSTRHQNSLSYQRVFHVCYLAYPFVRWSCFVQANTPGDAAQAAAQPKGENIRRPLDCFRTQNPYPGLSTIPSVTCMFYTVGPLMIESFWVKNECLQGTRGSRRSACDPNEKLK